MEENNKTNISVSVIAKYAVVIVIIAVIFVATCVNVGSAPTDKTIYFIDNNNVYYSPPLMESDPRPFAYAMFAEDAVAEGYEPLDDAIAGQTNYDALVYGNPKNMKWVIRSATREQILVTTITREELREINDRRPDSEHRKQDGFQDWCGPFTWLLRKIGLAKPRFDPNGEWNW